MFRSVGADFPLCKTCAQKTRGDSPATKSTRFGADEHATTGAVFRLPHACPGALTQGQEKAPLPRAAQRLGRGLPWLSRSIRYGVATPPELPAAGGRPPVPTSVTLREGT